MSSSSVFWRRQLTMTADVVVLHPAAMATCYTKSKATAEVKINGPSRHPCRRKGLLPASISEEGRESLEIFWTHRHVTSRGWHLLLIEMMALYLYLSYLNFKNDHIVKAEDLTHISEEQDEEQEILNFTVCSQQPSPLSAHFLSIFLPINKGDYCTCLVRKASSSEGRFNISIHHNL